MSDALGAASGWTLYTTDSFKSCAEAIRHVSAGRPAVHVRIDNVYGSRGVVRTTWKRALGSKWAHEEAMIRNTDSKMPNTSFIERLNLNKQVCCSVLRRGNPASARSPGWIQEALELVRAIYNYVRVHSSLRTMQGMRTPAMVAGITKRPFLVVTCRAPTYHEVTEGDRGAVRRPPMKETPEQEQRMVIEAGYVLVERPPGYTVVLSEQPAALSKIAALCDTLGSRKVLILGSKTAVRLSTSEVFDLGEAIAGLRLKVAVVEAHDSPAEHVELLEIVAINRGGPIQFFEDERSAMDWLGVLPSSAIADRG